MNKRIIAYITDNKERVVSSGILLLVVPAGDERENMLDDLEKAIGAEIVGLKNGDHILLNKS